MIFGSKCKALTFSFDDGNEDDVRLIGILNKYGLKGTFNLNSGLLTRCSVWKYNEIKDVRHIDYYENLNLYDGHEIACHSYTHPHLIECHGAALKNQIKLDKNLLEHLYSRKIRGMAYPFSTYNDEVIEVLKENGLEYSRSTTSTNDFSLPDEPYVWQPTCHFMSSNAMELAERFVNDTSGEDKLFYIWGHSYELVTEEDWQNFLKLCAFLSGREDIFYGTNIEVLDCIDSIGI